MPADEAVRPGSRGPSRRARVAALGAATVVLAAVAVTYTVQAVDGRTESTAVDSAFGLDGCGEWLMFRSTRDGEGEGRVARLPANGGAPRTTGPGLPPLPRRRRDGALPPAAHRHSAPLVRRRTRPGVGGEASRPAGRRPQPRPRLRLGADAVLDQPRLGGLLQPVKGKTDLVEGNTRKWTARALRENAECPSLSPDGRRLAFKKKVPGGGAAPWRLHVLDLRTLRERPLAERRGVDDRAMWLNASQVAYARPGESGRESDIWSVPADGTGTPDCAYATAPRPSCSADPARA